MKIMLGDQEVGLGTYVDINTEDATASVEDVIHGEVFYNAEGRQVGTHVCPTVDELLPELSNPATAEQILSGYQAIDGEGVSMTGSHTCKTLTELLPTLSNPAGARQILSGYQAVNSSGNVVTGTAEQGYKVYTGTITTSSDSRTLTMNGFDFTAKGFAITLSSTSSSARRSSVVMGYISSMGDSALYCTGSPVNMSITMGQVSATVTPTMGNGECTVSVSGSTNLFVSGTYHFVVWGE